MFLSQAERMWRRLQPDVPPPSSPFSPSSPFHGTGPWGAAGGKRWVTVSDVLAHCAVGDVPSRAPWEWRRRGESSLSPLLRDYQEAAVRAVVSDDGRVLVRSGLVEMECGTGKTFVGGEVVRLCADRRLPAVVVTQHALSVDQWVEHFQRHVVGMEATAVTSSSSSSSRRWSVLDPLPDVLVTTYQSLVRVVKLLEEQRRRTQRGGVGDVEVEELRGYRLLSLLFCDAASLGVLVLDEVHTAVADQFVAACRLRARAVVGLTGSLVREDDRVPLLTRLVGEVLFRLPSSRTVSVRMVRVTSMPEETRRALASVPPRSKLGHAIRTLQPHKVRALREVLATDGVGRRVLLFCDSYLAAGALAKTVLAGRSLLLRGGTDHAAREEMLRVFAASPPGSLVLVATRVCDAAIDFPDGCLVVQMHVSSGSRQQEVQRCGRAARGAVGGGRRHVRMVHLYNAATEEEGFVEKRVGYVCAKEAEGVSHVSSKVEVVREDVCYPDEGEDTRALQSLLVVRLKRQTCRRHAPRRAPRRPVLL